MNYWILARRFADLQQELTKILRPLTKVRVIIDRRVRQRPAEWSAYPEAPRLWSVPEEGTEDGGKSQDGLGSPDGIKQESNAT